MSFFNGIPFTPPAGHITAASPFPLDPPIRFGAAIAAVHEENRPCVDLHSDLALRLSTSLKASTAHDAIIVRDLVAVRIAEALLDPVDLGILGLEVRELRIELQSEDQDGDATLRVPVLQPEAAVLAVGIGGQAHEALSHFLRGCLGDGADGLGARLLLGRRSLGALDHHVVAIGVGDGGGRRRSVGDRALGLGGVGTEPGQHHQEHELFHGTLLEVVP